ncbi:hypothetical protein ABEB36_007826 [Hypothenemus hampei]|uniref:non-specific serine/threonine protein kinase n=1 Tax=Hypothenemus hampei TaxID=57062 RepID=A0ABD1EXQ8_HYPHA
MSLRALGGKLYKHGTTLIRQVQKAPRSNVNLSTRTVSNSVKPLETASGQKSEFFKSNRYQIFRNIGIQVSQRARQVLIEDVLNRVTNRGVFQSASKRGLYGNTAPLLGLVGFAAVGQGLLTKDEELEGICWELRECMSKTQWNRELNIQENFNEGSSMNLKLFTVGEPIDKGANAVVYSVEVIDELRPKINFPLALKMMFNYDIQSNSLAILNAMYKETVPASVYFNHQGFSDFEYEFLNRTNHLPPHPNIVKILSVFTDFVPELEKCKELYPAALPKRIDPNGDGRNMSLFILMKKYDMNLKKYLENSEKPSVRVSVLLLTQLLEAVVHMVANNVAHRDLKGDNILLDLSDPRSPLTVISDFGCCLAEKSCELSIPYNNFNVDKGGNVALMAPEIRNQKPGPFNRLNYHKSDLWAIGALAYELFGAPNPFYGHNKLNSTSYKNEELPLLPAPVPLIFKNLIKNILRRDPNDRLDPDIVANVCQLFLWAPKLWLDVTQKFPTFQEILEWLLNLAAKILCENPQKEHFTEENLSYAEYLLLSTFLCRVKLNGVRTALYWIRDNAN